MEEQNLEVVQQKKSIFHSGIFKTIIIFVLIVVIVSILSFLNFIPLKKLISLKTFAPQVEKTTEPGPHKIGILCPVRYTDCLKKQLTNYNGHSAALFTIGKNYSAYAIGNLLSITTDSATVGKDKAQLNRYTFIYNNACYTATYIFPHSMLINNFAVFPYPRGAAIARAQGDEVLTLNNQSFNVLLLLQKRAVDPDSKKSNIQRCTLTDPKESASGTYVDLSTVTFD